jgi:hypothetical protein
VTALPAPVRDLVGADHERLVTWGPNLVVRGAGLVGKVGPSAARSAVVLSMDLPVATPRLVAHGPGWVVMEDVADHGEPWDEAGVFQLLADLSLLHAFDHSALVGSPLDEPLSTWWRRVSRHGNLDVPMPTALRRVALDPAPLFEVLDRAPRRLVHADPYRHNVRRPSQGQRVWIDWDDALLAPAELDVAAWMLEGHWFLGRRISFDEVRATYRPQPAAPPPDEARLAAALLLVTATQDLVSLRDDEGEAALTRFLDERLDALDRLGRSG